MNAGADEETARLAGVLESMGRPADKCAAMAAQLEKRATQLARERGGTREEATAYLIQLMGRGWTANPNPPKT